MSRYQFRHGRTLDAVELRGGKSIQAQDVRVGDTVMVAFLYHGVA